MNEKIIKKIIIKEYINSSIQYGHTLNLFNSKMAPYILYNKYNYHIFDLFKALKLLIIAGNVLKKKAQNKNMFLFVGTTDISSSLVKKYAEKTNSSYINFRWLNGMLTNWFTLQKRIQNFKEIEKNFSIKIKSLNKLKKLFDGIKNLNEFPEIVIFTNQLKETNAIKECIKMGIPTICIVDSNGNPELIPYPVISNDDSKEALNFILNYFSNEILLNT